MWRISIRHSLRTKVMKILLHHSFKITRNQTLCYFSSCSRVDLFGISKTIGGWEGLYCTVIVEAFTNVVTPSVVIPYPVKRDWM